MSEIHTGQHTVFQFGKRWVGPEYPVLIIAEIGINHEGNRDFCAEMIQAAANSGADAVKFQTVDPDLNYAPNTTSYALFKRARLNREQTAEMFHLSRTLGMEVFTSIGDLASLRWVSELDPAAYKISSGMLTHLPFIRNAAKLGKPVLMSTGMCNDAEIDEAVDAARAAGGSSLCLLHCVSEYPTPVSSLKLRKISVLEKRYGLPVGYSDHSLGHEAAVLAVALGACIIEKHFTLEVSRADFDHKISLNPEGFAALVKAVRKTEQMLGTGYEELSDDQKAMAQQSLRSIVALRDIQSGELIDEEMIGFLRTDAQERGLPPKHYDQILGKRAKCNLKLYKAIRIEDLY